MSFQFFVFALLLPLNKILNKAINKIYEMTTSLLHNGGWWMGKFSRSRFIFPLNFFSHKKENSSHRLATINAQECCLCVSRTLTYLLAFY